MVGIQDEGQKESKDIQRLLGEKTNADGGKIYIKKRNHTISENGRRGKYEYAV